MPASTKSAWFTPAAWARARAAASIGRELSVPMTFQPCSARGIALRAAPHPMSSAIGEGLCRWCAAKARSVSLGGDWTNPCTVSGVLQRLMSLLIHNPPRCPHDGRHTHPLP